MQILETRADESLQSYTSALLWTFFLSPTGCQAAGSPCCLSWKKMPQRGKTQRSNTICANQAALLIFRQNLNIYFCIYSSLDDEILKGVLVSSLVPARSTQLIDACEFI